MADTSNTQKGESPDEWYEREKAAFIAWWESEGQKKFGETPTLAAGAGWLARAEAMRSETAATFEQKYPHVTQALLEQDSKRYRWLRRQKHADIAACWLVEDDADTPEQLDAAIDRSIKNAAPQGASADENRSTPERARSGRLPGNDAGDKGKCGDSSVSRSAAYEPAVAAPTDIVESGK